MFSLIVLKKEQKAEGEERPEKKKKTEEMERERNHLQPAGEIEYSVLRQLILHYIFIHIDKNSCGN